MPRRLVAEWTLHDSYLDVVYADICVVDNDHRNVALKPSFSVRVVNGDTWKRHGREALR